MHLARAVDTLLDRSVVGGYGSPGLALRRRLPSWPADPVRMDGKVVVVTGATAGLGRAAAEGFARLGAEVHVVGRDKTRTSAAADAISQQVPGSTITPAVCDVASRASLRAFCQGWSGPLDVLVNNAGVMTPTRQVSDDGVELTFATNVLGPFALTQRLRSAMPPGARVINVSSGGMYGQPLGDDLQNEHDFTPVRAYARSKRAEVVLTELWARELPEIGVHAMHPGWAATPGIESSLATFSKVAKPILRTPDQGADTIVWLGGAEVPSGLFWHDRRARPTHLLRRTRETHAQRERLWELCCELSR